jgi:hypothetical protein
VRFSWVATAWNLNILAAPASGKTLKKAKITHPATEKEIHFLCSCKGSNRALLEARRLKLEDSKPFQKAAPVLV